MRLLDCVLCVSLIYPFCCCVFAYALVIGLLVYCVLLCSPALVVYVFTLMCLVCVLVRVVVICAHVFVIVLFCVCVRCGLVVLLIFVST